MSTIATSALPDPQATRPEDVTPPRFLTAVFGSAWADDAWVCCVDNLEPDPNDASAVALKNQQMFGCLAGRVVWSGVTNANCYFNVGVTHGSRKRLAVKSNPVLVLDDVVEKCDAEKVRSTFGPPSFIVQTSPKSQQWGYIFDQPVNDIGQFERLVRATIRAFYPAGDPGMVGANRLVRLPWGKNTKSKYGTPSPGVELIEWEPERRYDPILELAASIVDAWNAEEHTGRGTSNALSGRDPVSYLETDDIMQGLLKMGRLHLDKLQGDGYLQVTCPWEDTHTVTDDRSGYCPETEHYKCFHGDAGLRPKTAEDVRDFLRSELGTVEWKRIQEATQVARSRRAADIFAKYPVSPEQVEAAAVAAVDRLKADLRNTRVPKKQRAKSRWMPLGKHAPTTPLPARRAICSFMARGETTFANAQPEVGKSAFLLDLALAIAANRPDLVGEREFKRRGDVFIVSNEDGADVARRRRKGWLEKTGVDPDTLEFEPFVDEVPGFKAVGRVARGEPIILLPAMHDLADDIAAARAAGREVCAVALDTMGSVFLDIEENSNGDTGEAITLLNAWAEENDVSVVLAHHMQKANGRAGGAGDMSAIRGAGALAGGARLSFTLTELPPQDKAKLPPGIRDRIVRFEGSKGNHAGHSAQRHFIRELPAIAVVDMVTGECEVDKVPVMLPYALDLGWNPADENNRLRVLHAVADAEAAKEPLRMKAGSKNDNAAGVLAEDWGEDAKDIADTLKVLERDGFLRTLSGPRNSKGNSPLVWGVTPEGRSWMDGKARSVGFDAVEPENEAPGGEPAAAEPTAEPSARSEEPPPGRPHDASLFDGLKLDFGQAAPVNFFAGSRQTSI